MRPYLLITATLFGLIALAHVSRLLRHWPVNLGSYTVPLGVPWLGLLVAGGLCIWALRLARTVPRA